ncbi:hypothetical protein CBR_g20232 [Chara braunii]|uniref:BTB domain-containing protein n=1 Tax=Chara braunii TaxID=69332 RepID=A0A388KZZ7_CHABU|nr:hypothetical protein CBR_g20232 [Chara braunii]|eukprot:GBG75601.1 hypothetical protein CBR_g20232 [Chara braunii]
MFNPEVIASRKRRASDAAASSNPPLLHQGKGEEEEHAEHEREFLSAAQTILDRPELLDVAFVCQDGTKVRANRTILASGSEFFSKLLYGDMKESTMDTIPLPTARAGSLQLVINYLHGRRLRWEPGVRWDEMVELYSLAAQYQVDSLCQRIARRVPMLGSARDFGDLLNAAIPRQAEEVVKEAVKVMNKVLAFDSTSFKGWSKESIKCCLEKVRFHPNVTETMIAEAVLSAAPNIGSSTVRREDSLGPSVVRDSTPDDSQRSQNPVVLGAPTPPSCSEGTDDHDARTDGSLSRTELRELFERYINLAFVDPPFVKTRIEALQIVRPEVLSAVYKVQSICLSRGLSAKSLFTIPSRSLRPRVSFPPVTEAENAICSAYSDVLVPVFVGPGSEVKVHNFRGVSTAC